MNDGTIHRKRYYEKERLEDKDGVLLWPYWAIQVETCIQNMETEVKDWEAKVGR